MRALKFLTGHMIYNLAYRLGCANKDLWALCASISVVYCKTATSYFLGGKE